MAQVSAADLHPDGTPKRLGTYRLVRAISTGGMARVFLGRRDSLAGVAPRVAIKVILPEHAANEGFQQLFINEARIGAMLHHQNLVQIQDFNCDGSHYYLVMEYVEGFTFRKMISLCRRNGLAVPLPLLAEMGRQVCDGLYYAHTARSEDGHELHLVHRDLKPSNLMLNPQGVAKLLDFGVSKAYISQERAGAVRGTWGYMSPEQSDGLTVGPGADLFGLAAVLYEVAAHEALFPEKEPAAIRQLLASDEAARRANRLVGPMSPLSRVLVRALQRDPAARYSSAAAMGRALGELITDPVSTREELTRFQSRMFDLAEGGAPPRSRPMSAVPIDPGPGLHVAIGGLAPARNPAIQPGQDVQPVRRRRLGPWLAAGFALIGLGIVGYTGWQLTRPPAASPIPLKTSNVPNPLEELAADEPSSVPTAQAPPKPQPKPPPPEAPASVVPPPPPDPVPVVAPAHDVKPTREVRPPRDTRPAAEPAVERARIAPPEDTPPPVPVPPQPDPVVPVEAPPADAPAPVQTVVVAAPADTDTGRLTVSSIPRAQVVVDGKYIRYSPLFRFEVDAGSRVVTLIADDGRRTTFKVDVAAGAEVRKVWSFEDGAFVGP